MASLNFSKKPAVKLKYSTNQQCKLTLTTNDLLAIQKQHIKRGIHTTRSDCAFPYLRWNSSCQKNNNVYKTLIIFSISWNQRKLKKNKKNQHRHAAKDASGGKSLEKTAGYIGTIKKSAPCM